jgi:CDP-4-dehydro-6-deoxyglucose reductase
MKQSSCVVRSALYQVNHCWPLARYVSQIILQSAQAEIIPYEAGQYLHVLHADQSYSPLSIACAPVDVTTIELHLSHRPENTKAQDILRMATQEQQLLVRGAYGTCTLMRYLPNMPLIFLARGTGFAPIKAHLEALVLQRDARPIYFYWSAALAEDFYFLELLEQWQKDLADFHFTPVLGEQEKLPQAVLADFSDLAACQIYASGPAKMVYGALDFFSQHGLVAGRFYSDLL